MVEYFQNHVVTTRLWSEGNSLWSSQPRAENLCLCPPCHSGLEPCICQIFIPQVSYPQKQLQQYSQKPRLSGREGIERPGTLYPNQIGLSTSQIHAWSDSRSLGKGGYQFRAERLSLTNDDQPGRFLNRQALRGVQTAAASPGCWYWLGGGSFASSFGLGKLQMGWSWFPHHLCCQAFARGPVGTTKQQVFRTWPMKLFLPYSCLKSWLCQRLESMRGKSNYSNYLPW